MKRGSGDKRIVAEHEPRDDDGEGGGIRGKLPATRDIHEWPHVLVRLSVPNINVR